jgi:hypothetical protein
LGRTAYRLPRCRHGDGRFEAAPHHVAHRNDDPAVGQTKCIVPIAADKCVRTRRFVDRIEPQPGNRRQRLRQRGVLKSQEGPVFAIEFPFEALAQGAKRAFASDRCGRFDARA